MAAVLKPGETDTSDGLSLEREAWRAGRDMGRKEGAATFFNSPVMEQIAVELTTLRVLYAAVCAECERRGQLIDWWKGEKEWWQAECLRVGKRDQA